MVQSPDFNLPDPCIDMTPKRESTVLGAGRKRTALNSWTGSCSRCYRGVAHPLLRRVLARTMSFMSIWMRVGRGPNPLYTLLPPRQAGSPRMWPPLACAGGMGGPGSRCGCRRLAWASYHVARGPLQEKSEVHRGTKACKGAKVENIGHIRPTFARSSCEWE